MLSLATEMLLFKMDHDVGAVEDTMHNIPSKGVQLSIEFYQKNRKEHGIVMGSRGPLEEAPPSNFCDIGEYQSH